MPCIWLFSEILEGCNSIFLGVLDEPKWGYHRYTIPKSSWEAPLLRRNGRFFFPSDGRLRVESLPVSRWSSTKRSVALSKRLENSWMNFAGLEVSFGEEVGDGQSALAALAHHLLSQVCTKGLVGVARWARAYSSDEQLLMDSSCQ